MKNLLVLDMTFLPDQIWEPSPKNSAYLFSTAKTHSCKQLKTAEGWTSSTKAVPLVFLLFRGHERFAKTRGVAKTPGKRAFRKQQMVGNVQDTFGLLQFFSRNFCSHPQGGFSDFSAESDRISSTNLVGHLTHNH